MTKLVFATIIFPLLSGCITKEYDYKITHPDVMYVGDSLCYKVWDTDSGIDGVYKNEDYLKTAEREAGIVIDCVPGRKATDIEALPERSNGEPWRVIFVALGTNDVGKTDIDEFRLQYQILIDNADYETLYCVLPNIRIKGKDAKPYRQVILETCSNVIDPLDHGVRFRAKDTVHKTKADQPGWWAAITERI
jgi:hypothetical protein